MYLELLLLAAPEAILALAAVLVLSLGLAGPRGAAFTPPLAALGIVAAAYAVGRLPEEAVLFGGMLVLSPLVSLFKVICLALALFTVVMARDEEVPRNQAEFLALILLGTIGLLLLVGSEELLMVFIGLELTGLALYLMTAFDKRDRHSAEAGLKYFLFGSTASAFTLFGLSLVYGMTGSTGFDAIASRFTETPAPLLAVGLLMTLIGFAFKIAAAPFHLWVADTYQGAPVPAAAFIASGSKVAAFVVLGKLVLTAFGPAIGNAEWGSFAPGWAPLLALLAAASIIVGNLVALAQKNVRRLLGYSAVAHAGYALLGLVAGRDGFASTLFYTTIYAFTLVGAFGVIALVRHETGGDDLDNFAGLRARSPLLAGCFCFFLLSLAGLPPLAGFFGKFYLFSAALAAGPDHGLLWLVALALLGSLVSLYYYLVVMKLVLVSDAPLPAPGAAPAFLPRVTISILAGFVLFLGLLPDRLVSRIITALF